MSASAPPLPQSTGQYASSSPGFIPLYKSDYHKTYNLSVKTVFCQPWNLDNRMAYDSKNLSSEFFILSSSNAEHFKLPLTPISCHVIAASFCSGCSRPSLVRPPSPTFPQDCMHTSLPTWSPTESNKIGHFNRRLSTWTGPLSLNNARPLARKITSMRYLLPSFKHEVFY